jgi:regulator of replication initiation timing
MILHFSKETKLALTKLTEQNRQLTRENEKLQDELAGNINRGQTSEYQYSQQLEEL